MLLFAIVACQADTYLTPERLLNPPNLSYEGTGTGTGLIEIEGEPRAWNLTDNEAGWALQSEGEPDLAGLDGLVGSVAVNTDGTEFWPDEVFVGDELNYRSLTIHTDEAVEYETSSSEPYAGRPSLFGDGFVRYGEELGSFAHDYWLLTVYELVFVTDEGELTLGPGESATATLGGFTYRITALSAWTTEILDESVGQPKCGGLGDRAGYEVVRIADESAVGEGAMFTREADIRRSSCG